MSIDKHTLPYYPELVRLRSFLEKEVEDFPRFKCEYATRLVHLVTGLEEVSGRYVPDEDLHAWNYDPKGKLYVDITQDQYPHRGKIVVMPSHTPILRAEDCAIKEHHATIQKRRFRRQVSELLGAYLLNQSTQHHRL